MSDARLAALVAMYRLDGGGHEPPADLDLELYAQERIAALAPERFPSLMLDEPDTHCSHQDWERMRKRWQEALATP